MLSKKHRKHKTLLVGQQSSGQLLTGGREQDGVDPQELEFYGSLIERFRATTNQSMLNKRAAIAKEDPTEEIIELHLEVQEFEKEFKECVEIATFMLTKTRELDEVIRTRSNKFSNLD